ncbi:MAG: hypothetical protein JWM32_3271 [Verrucomicrobia bacterium]|nr:hypothetical protein [Verrucomicrobiota bacterium]
MAFRFTGSLHDDLHVALRTDGTSTNLSGEFDSGLFANFSMQSDTGSPTGNISLGSYDYPNSSAGILSLGTFSMVQNQTYLVRILDDGTNVSLFVNNLIIPFLTASSTASYGNQIGFYDREGAGAGSFISAGSQVKVDFFSVTGSPEEVASVPEGGMTAAFLGLSCVVMGCALRKHQ